MITQRGPLDGGPASRPADGASTRAPGAVVPMEQPRQISDRGTNIADGSGTAHSTANSTPATPTTMPNGGEFIARPATATPANPIRNWQPKDPA